MHLIAVGLSFRSAPIAVRERAMVSEEEALELLGYLAGRPGLDGAAVLSTCNRTEFYVSCSDAGLLDEVVPRLGRYLDPGNGDISEHLNEWRGADAVEHIFRVACGLESMVLGEAQVLGQIKHAHAVAQRAGSLDPDLDLILRRAIEVGKRVRNETEVGRGAGSLSEVAVRLAESRQDGIAGRGALVIGAGTMGRLLTRRLRDGGAEVVVTSRSGSARTLADELGVTAVDRDALSRHVAGVDVVVSSTSSATTVVSARDVGLWQAARNGRPLLIIDLAVPRDVEPAASGIAGVTLIDIDELGRGLTESLDRRRRAAEPAAAIIAAEVAGTIALLQTRRGAAAAIAELVGRVEEVWRSELERAALSEEERQRLEAICRSVAAKLVHAPITELRRHAGDPAAQAEILRLFGATAPEPGAHRSSRITA